MVLAGKSCVEVAKKMKISNPTVAKWLKQAGYAYKSKYKTNNFYGEWVRKIG